MPLRITGLVRIANALRRELAHPLIPARREHWRKLVSNTLTQTDHLLRQHHARPESLPAPSRRAIQFLQSIPWDNLPTSPAHQPPAPPPTTVSWPGLGAFLERILDRLALAPGPLDPIHHSIDTTSRRIEGTIARTAARPENLTPASRAIRGWLAFFAQRDNLALYTQALALATPLLQAAVRAQKHPLPLVIHFRHAKVIYRIRPHRGGSALWLPTPMIAFDAPAFARLADLIASRTPQAKHRVVADMAAEPFQTLHAELESLGGIDEHLKGAAHDLAAAFDRVNAQFFAGQMPRPRLTWSRVFTGRKFGHYDSLRDTVMLSSTLDQPSVPEFVIDYLLYHELLHKHLGVRLVNGRRYVHTPEFYAAERKFPRHAEAETILQRLARHLAPVEHSPA